MERLESRPGALRSPLPEVRPSGGPAWSFGTFLICGYAFLLPVQISVGPGRVAPSDVLLLVYVALWFTRVRHVREGWSPWHGLILIVFATGLVVALLRSGDVLAYAVVQKTLGVIFLFVGYAVLLDRSVDERGARQLLRWFLLGVVLHAAVASGVYVLQIAGAVSTSIINFENARVSGLLVDPNAFGGIVVVALVLHVWTARSAQPVWSWRGRAAAGVVLLTALVLTFSRSAWIAFLLVIAVSFVLRGRRGLRALPGYFAVALALGVGLVLALRPGILQLAVRQDQVTGRLEILRDAWHEAERSPVFGVGLGTYVREHGVIVHNTPAWFLTEFGIAGLIVLVGFIGWYLVRLWHLARVGYGDDRSLAFAVLLAQVAMIGLSLGIEAFYQRYWWLLFAVAGAIFARSAPRGAER